MGVEAYKLRHKSEWMLDDAFIAFKTYLHFASLSAYGASGIPLVGKLISSGGCLGLVGAFLELSFADDGNVGAFVSDDE